MAIQTEMRPEPRGPASTRSFLRPIGVVLLFAGLVGMGYWALRGFSASYSATLDEDSIAAQAVYVIDWIPKPGLEDKESDDSADFLVIAHDEDGNVIWEGPQNEWGALLGEAETNYQADLRNRWLYPSAALALIGLLIVIFTRRRGAAEKTHT